MKLRAVSFIISVIMLVSVVVPVGATDSGALYDSVIEYAEPFAKAIENMEGEFVFDDGGISTDEMKLLVTVTFNENPLFFHFSNDYNYGYKTDPVTGETVVTKLFLKYKMTAEEYSAGLSEVRAWRDEVIALVDPSFTDMEKALFFHDYLCANYSYDTTLAIHDIYNFIKTGVGVCQSYTYAYAYLLEGVGIESSWASSGEMNHIWNLVKLDSEWYHADVTWDDPIGNTYGSANHKYFLKSDAAISTKDGGHFGWISRYACTSDKYDDSPVSSIGSAMVPLGDKWYYFSEGNLYAADSPDSTGTEVKKLGYIWNVWESSKYYIGCYSGLMAYSGKLYFNSATGIMSFDPAKGTLTTVYTYTGGSGYIYGFSKQHGIDDGYTVMVNIATAPGKTVELTSTDLSKIYGDASGDGKVNLGDAALVLKYIAKWSVSMNADMADIDRNGKVNLSDVSGIMKKIAGWS